MVNQTDNNGPVDYDRMPLKRLGLRHQPLIEAFARWTHN
jgi:hypothetical protein